MPGLHVKSCAIVIDQAARAPTSDDRARLIIAWDHERGLSNTVGGVAFRAGALLPEAFRPARRHTLMVQPLCFQSEALGWCVLEMDPPRAAVGEAIPAQISASFKVIALQEHLAAAATKR